MKKNEPKLSIITPSYNSSKYIKDCIKSVLSQNYPNFEHIVIDGGSNDNTLDLLKQYPHLIWISEPDDGQSDALNKGFKLASGEIIGWCNSDDVYTENTFQKVAKYFQDEKLDALYSNIYFSDSTLNITRKLITHKPVRWLSLFQCYIPSAAFFFRKAILNNGTELDVTKEISMDKEFFANLISQGYKLRYIDDFFAIFRWHENNKSVDTKEVKYLRYKEGLEIFNRYNGITTLKITNFNMLAYKIIANITLIFKKYYQLTSKQ